jgi:IS605 OrfB family transposase
VDTQDQSWREALWLTHEMVNKGAKVFGDWLLTLRGGLDHTLADTKGKDGKEKHGCNPTDEERKARRILLALSWLSVESRLGAPEKFIIASGQDAAEERNGKVVAALEEILNSRGVEPNEINAWKINCSASLSAAIRDDAVWVNRSKAFDDAVKSIGCPLPRDKAWDMLGRFFESEDAYLAPLEGSEDESSDTEQEDKAKDLVKKAGEWLSNRFGKGKGADFSRMADVYGKIAAWAGNAQAGTTGNNAINELATALSEFTPASNDLQGVLGLISGPGYKSKTRNLLTQLAQTPVVTQDNLKDLNKRAAADTKKCKEKIGSKGQQPYANAILKEVESVCGFTYLQNGGTARHCEFAVMLDHAARRVSLVHTWIKRAEAERRRFEKDLQMLGQVPSAVKEWLDKYCEERSNSSGALEPYRIRRRAVDGWEKVVAAWSKTGCKTPEDRITAARVLQDDPAIDKFGDIQLFEALAEDDAVCVWHKDGDPNREPDPQPLIDYVRATEANFKKQQFKVPAYRHPDAFLHPVFCDFGKSRWDIEFAIHEARKVKATKSALRRKNRQCFDSSRELFMTLWTGNEMKRVPMGWQSKRLARDLALGQNTPNDGAPEVPRADRLGRAASNVTKSNEVKIAGLFEEAEWNGRLQAPRRQLEAIARRVDKHQWDAKAKKMRDQLHWLITFSPKLRPTGPWFEYAATFPDNALAKPSVSRKGTFFVKYRDNERPRKGGLILSRLPGLRLLSVDLGHRYAAACAVWETLSKEKFEGEIKGRKVRYSDSETGGLFCHTEHGNNAVTIYRRIGADMLPDGTPHPAPWARLDRQFLIKLQGEEEETRAASNQEIWAVHQLEAELGRTSPIIDRLVKAGWGQSGQQRTRLDVLCKLGWKPISEDRVSDGTDEGEYEVRKPSLSVDELMFSAVRTMRLALKRHGDRARIAFAMTAEYKPMPGDRKYYFTEAKDLSTNDDQVAREHKQIEFIQDALVLWHGLFSSRGWQDDAARKLWDDHVAKLSGYNAPEEIREDASGVERKKKQKENREKLYSVAKALAGDATLRKALHDAWKTRWKEDDERWKRQIRWFKDWILPRGKASNDPAIRKVGGLSLTRLATLTEFRRKVQVGFFTRLHPDGTKAETKEHLGQSVLDTLEHLREQRVKQLASRIAEAALGIGSENRKKHWDGRKRARERIKDPRFIPCHAIVIENLTYYRPEETRTRRENRQLMSWSSSKVKKYLAEACQLHGLHLREVSAGYTSRQDSRTGAPGIRCQDVSIKEFMQLPFWRKEVARAEKKRAEGKGDARECFLCELNAQWKDKSKAAWGEAGIVRIPLKGGEIFVSADKNSPAAKGLQADLNAAANIGLKALADPDWPGKWWFVPCNSTTFEPLKDKVGGFAAIRLNESLKKAPASWEGEETKKKRSRDVVNLWRDVSSQPISASDDWREFTPYWNGVQTRVVNILRQSAGPIMNHGER